MWTAKFWKDATERAIKTTAQVAGAALAGNAFSLWVPVEAVEIAKLALASGIISVLTSVGSSAIGDGDSASLVNQDSEE